MIERGQERFGVPGRALGPCWRESSRRRLPGRRPDADWSQVRNQSCKVRWIACAALWRLSVLPQPSGRTAPPTWDGPGLRSSVATKPSDQPGSQAHEKPASSPLRGARRRQPSLRWRVAHLLRSGDRLDAARSQRELGAPPRRFANSSGSWLLAMLSSDAAS